MLIDKQCVCFSFPSRPIGSVREWQERKENVCAVDQSYARRTRTNGRRQKKLHCASLRFLKTRTSTPCSFAAFVKLSVKFKVDGRKLSRSSLFLRDDGLVVHYVSCEQRLMTPASFSSENWNSCPSGHSPSDERRMKTLAVRLSSTCFVVVVVVFIDNIDFAHQMICTSKKKTKKKISLRHSHIPRTLT